MSALLLPILSSAGLWLGGSLLVGALANRLPCAWLQQTLPDRPAGPSRRPQHWLGIRRWKAWIPDAGAALPGGISKASLARRDPAALQRLLLETRRAELVHWALWPIGLLTLLWLPPAGVLLNLIFGTAFNLPCLLLQRYNHARLQRLLSARASRPPA